MQGKRHIVSDIKCYDVITDKQGKKIFGSWSYYISFKRSIIADHFFTKVHDLKITQKRNISHFLQLCDKKKSKARNHWNPFFNKHTQIINHQVTLCVWIISSKTLWLQNVRKIKFDVRHRYCHMYHSKGLSLLIILQ